MYMVHLHILQNPKTPAVETSQIYTNYDMKINKFYSFEILCCLVVIQSNLISGCLTPLLICLII